jgi:two-component system, probable response regulator PhcQ
MSEPEHTVLLVDDEAEIVESLRRTLRAQSYRVIGTTSPFDALDLCERENVDLVVADIDMPGMNGLELVARIRRTHPHVVRILLTGDASLESALHAINEGEVHRYLTKPWNKDELRETLRLALDRLEEIRRGAAADRVARAREAMLSELESAHPGIRAVDYQNGVYTLDSGRMAELGGRIGLRAAKPDPGESSAISGDAPTQVVKGT